MKDWFEGQSLVIVYYGGRGSGKTLSATAQAARALKDGQDVWSNYRIAFPFRKNNGDIIHCESKPVDINDLIMIQRNDTIRNGIVMLDEWNLWCNSRRSGANVNYVFNGIVQIIRKRELSFFITVQSFHSLDRFIREQCDVTTLCHDLHFNYPRLSKGSQISQEVTDWSGALTGRAIYNDGGTGQFRYDRERNTRHRILVKGKKFWFCYETGFEFDVLEAMQTRYTMEKRTVNIGLDGIAEDGGFRGALAKEKLEALASILPNGTRFTREEFHSMLAQEDLDTDMSGHTGKAAKAAGFDYHRRHNGEIYYQLEKRGGEE